MNFVLLFRTQCFIDMKTVFVSAISFIKKLTYMHFSVDVDQFGYISACYIEFKYCRV